MQQQDFQPRVLDPEFEILGLLGRGGAASVVRARQRSLGREVALKILSAELSTKQRKPFFREATRLASLDHPHIVKVFDFGVIGANRPCLVLQFVQSRDLRAVLEKTRRIPVSRIVPLVVQACDALTYTHARGIVHRDIKPANLLVAGAGTRSEHVMVADFGIARDTGKRVNTSVIEVVSGTPAWMSPEQCEGRPARPTSDVYSLALVLYAALTGGNPFHRGDAVASMNAHFGPRPIPVADVRTSVSRALSRVIMGALAIEPSHRPQSAQAFRALLTAALPDGAPTADEATQNAPRSRRPERTISAMPALWASLGEDTVQDTPVVAALAAPPPPRRPSGLLRRHDTGPARRNTPIVDVMAALPRLRFGDALRVELLRVSQAGNLPWGIYLPTVMSGLHNWTPAKDGVGRAGVRAMSRRWAPQLDRGRGAPSVTTLSFCEHRLDALTVRFDTVETEADLAARVTTLLAREPSPVASALVWRTPADTWTLSVSDSRDAYRTATLRVARSTRPS